MQENITPTNTNATFTGLVAGPSTGKSTLLIGFEKAAIYVRGFVFADMSSIMDWHRDVENKSPFYTQLCQAKEKNQKTGELVNDSLTTNSLFYYINRLQEKAEKEIQGGIRKILLSGFPRTEPQKLILQSYFNSVRCGYIDCSRTVAEENRQKRVAAGIKRDDDKHEIFNRRWDIFENRTYPQVILPLEASCGKDEFVRIPFELSPREKALRLLKIMRVRPQEYASMRNQITNPACEAAIHFDSVKKITSIRTESSREPWALHSGSIPHFLQTAVARA